MEGDFMNEKEWASRENIYNQLLFEKNQTIIKLCDKIDELEQKIKGSEEKKVE